MSVQVVEGSIEMTPGPGERTSSAISAGRAASPTPPSRPCPPPASPTSPGSTASRQSRRHRAACRGAASGQQDDLRAGGRPWFEVDPVFGDPCNGVRRQLASRLIEAADRDPQLRQAWRLAAGFREDEKVTDPETVLDDRTGIAYALAGIACHAAATAHEEDAALLLGAVEALHREDGTRTQPFLVPYLEEVRRRALGAIGQAGFEAAWREGQELEREQAIALALRAG